MKNILIAQLIKLVVGMLTPELLARFVDNTLNFIEDYVEGSASTVDDALVLPICTALRELTDVPDKD